MSDTPVDAFRAVPDEARRIWREHFGFFAADPTTGDAVLVHLSIDPVRRNGVFTLVAWSAGRRVKDIVQAPVPGRLEGLTSLSTDRLQVEVSEPGREARVRYVGNSLTLDLTYRTMAGPHRAPPASATALFPVDNEQQAVHVTGRLTIDGQPRPFDGLGSRDHSWGWFPEWPFRAHEWLTILLPDRAFQLSRTQRLEGAVNAAQVELVGGGSQALSAAQIDAPYWRVAPNEHLPVLDRDVVVMLTGSDGCTTRATLRLARAQSRHHSNKRDRQLDRIYEQVTMLAPVEAEDGAIGVVVVELGCLVERPGVCDEPLPGTVSPAAAKEGR